MENNNESIKKAEIKKDGQYELPELTAEINCPSCKEGIIKINRTIHSLPDEEEILILLMECNKCKYQNRDIISLNTKFGPGSYTLRVEDGDLTPKIFKSPGAYIFLPEADFEIEPGNTSGYTVTNLEGLLERIIKWTEYMKKNYEIEKRPELKKVIDTLKKLKKMKKGDLPFSVVLTDNEGGSYITVPPNKSNILSFDPKKV
jgi:ZPR1-related zinc finger protein